MPNPPITVASAALSRGIDRAVKAAGSQTALAEEMARRGHEAITPQAVQQWVTRGYVPPLRIAVVSEITGVPAVDLAHPAMRCLFVAAPAA